MRKEVEGYNGTKHRCSTAGATYNEEKEKVYQKRKKRFSKRETNDVVVVHRTDRHNSPRIHNLHILAETRYIWNRPSRRAVVRRRRQPGATQILVDCCHLESREEGRGRGRRKKEGEGESNKQIWYELYVSQRSRVG